MTLWEKFLNSTQPSSVVWKIYEKGTGKLLCADYGSLKTEDCTLDDLEIVKAEIKYNKYGLKYVRATVKTA